MNTKEKNGAAMIDVSVATYLAYELEMALAKAVDDIGKKGRNPSARDIAAGVVITLQSLYGGVCFSKEKFNVMVGDITEIINHIASF
jgi:hypothetical protein